MWNQWRACCPIFESARLGSFLGGAAFPYGRWLLLDLFLLLVCCCATREFTVLIPCDRRSSCLLSSPLLARFSSISWIRAFCASDSKVRTFPLFPPLLLSECWAGTQSPGDFFGSQRFFESPFLTGVPGFFVNS